MSSQAIMWQILVQNIYLHNDKFEKYTYEIILLPHIQGCKELN